MHYEKIVCALVASGDSGGRIEHTDVGKIKTKMIPLSLSRARSRVHLSLDDRLTWKRVTKTQFKHKYPSPSKCN